VCELFSTLCISPLAKSVRIVQIRDMSNADMIRDLNGEWLYRDACDDTRTTCDICGCRIGEDEERAEDPAAKMVFCIPCDRDAAAMAESLMDDMPMEYAPARCFDLAPTPTTKGAK